VASVEWVYFLDRLAPARTYWLATTTPDGAPHAAPVWGAVAEGRLCFFSERSTVKARNIAHDPRVLVHLESGEDVVMARGRLIDLGAPGDVPAVIAAFAAKYVDPADAVYLPPTDPASDVVWALEPTSATAWSLEELETSQVRWRA